MSELDELRLALRNAIQERESARIERDAARRWAQAWKAIARRLFKSNRLHLRLLFKENPEARNALTVMAVMGAFAYYQHEDEDVVTCALRIAKELDAALRVVEAARKCSQGGFRGVLRRVLHEFDAAQAKEKQT